MTQDVEVKVDTTEVSPVLTELRFEIPWETVKQQMDRRYNQLRKTARPMRGFRKGKTPRWLLEQTYGPQVMAEVSQKLLTDNLTKTLMESELAPVATPDIVPEQLEPEKPFIFKARVETRPKLEGVNYEGLELKRPIEPVTDEDVEREIESLREEAAAVRTPEILRPAQEGDVLTIDYEVFSIGGTAPERTREDQEVELGKGMLVDTVEEALMGAMVDQELSVPVELPSVPGKPDSEPKTLIFKIRVKEIREKVLPELDDEFVKDVSEHETLDELRAAVREGLEQRAAAVADNAVKDQLLDALCEANPVELPPSLVEQQFLETQAEIGRMLQMDLEQNPLGEEQTARMREQAERKVRAALLLVQVATDAGLEVSDEDVEARLKEIAEQSKQPLPKVKAEFGKEDRLEQLKLGMLQQSVVDHILSKANVTDGPPEEAAVDPGTKQEEQSDSEADSAEGEVETNDEA